MQWLWGSTEGAKEYLVCVSSCDHTLVMWNQIQIKSEIIIIIFERASSNLVNAGKRCRSRGIETLSP